MRTQSRDTTPDIERILIRGHQAFSPATRFGRVRSMTYFLAEANRHQPPALSDTERTVSFLTSQYGPAFADAFRAVEPPPTQIGFDLLATLERIAAVFAERQVRFALTGSLACCLYGFPRTCHDIDLLLDAGEYTHLGDVSCQFASVDAPDATPPTPPSGPVLASWLDPQTLIKVDLLTAAPLFLADHLLTRASLLALTEQRFTLPVLTAEDVLLTRLSWYQATGSRADDQWNDLMGLVKLQAPTLDVRYLTAQARHVQVSALLRQLCVDTEFERSPDDTADEYAGCPADDVARH